jgi:hypothetical protein
MQIEQINITTFAQALDVCRSLRHSAVLAKQAGNFNRLYADDVPLESSQRLHYLTRALNMYETSAYYDRIADECQAAALEMIGVKACG